MTLVSGAGAQQRPGRPRSAPPGPPDVAVERVLSMLKAEFELALGLADARTLGQLDRSLLVHS